MLNTETKKETTEIVEENKPTNLFKRIAAGFIDTFLLFAAAYGLYSLALITPVGDNIKSYRDCVVQIQDRCKLETGYGEKVTINQGEEGDYHLYSEDTETGVTYYIVKNVEFATASEKQTVYNAYVTLLNDNEKSYEITAYGHHYTGISFGEASTYYHIHNYLVTAVLIGGVLELTWFFIIPLIKNCGATPGMLCAGIRMISSKDYFKPRWTQYLGRFLFIYFIESLFPYFLIPQVTVVIVPLILMIILFFGRKKSRTLHDFVSSIMVIEKTTFIEHKSDDIIEVDAFDVIKDKEDNKEE